LNSVAEWAAASLLFAVALVVPGYALLLYIPPLVERLDSLVERAIAALCLSVLLTPVFFLAMRIVGLPIGGPMLVALQLAALAAIVLKLRSYAHPQPLPVGGEADALPLQVGGEADAQPLPVGEEADEAAMRPPAASSARMHLVAPNPAIALLPRRSVDVAGLALFAICLVGLAVRVHQAWGEVAPLGSDGYHHTLISQLIIEQQGVPRSYLPYAPLTSFTYHYGFHALVAISYWLGGWVMFGVGPLTTARLTLMVGQIISAFAPFAVYLLATTWLGSRVAGVVGALVTLLSIFPTYYLDWGRDPQMTGLLGLPVLLLVTTMLLDAPSAADPNRGVIYHALTDDAVNPNRGAINRVPTDTVDPNQGAINRAPTETTSAVGSRFIAPSFAATIRSYLVGRRVQALMLLAAALAAGLLLDHYRIIIAYAYFVTIYWLVKIVDSMGERNANNPQSTIYNLQSAIGLTARTAVVALLTLLIASPWLLNLLSGFSFTLQTGSKIPPPSFFSTRLSDIVDGWWWNAPLWQSGSSGGLLSLLPLLTSPLMILSVIGWGFGILYRNLYVISTGLLVLTLLLLSSPYFINLPFLSGRVDYQTVASLLWLPQGVLIGYLAVVALRFVPLGRHAPSPNLPRWGRSLEANTPTPSRGMVGVGASAALAVIIALLAALPLWDARERDPLESYLLPADIPALTWVQQHTNQNSLFLTNTFTWDWAPNSRTGSDSGLWLPLIAGGGRTATAPPLPYNNEKAIDPNYRTQVIATSRAANHIDQQQAVDYLRRLGVKYAYIGARGTSPALAPPNQSSNPALATARDNDLIISGSLDPAQFQRASQWWRQIYARDGVYIFELK
jgi:hypothetical protein